jgi:transcriptional regulator with XRE-family HTH domain
MNIGRIIRTLRTTAGMTQKELASRLDLSASALSLIESGDREPTIATLKAVSRTLGVPISVLFVESEEAHENMTPQQKADMERVQDLLADVLKTLVMEKFKSDDRRESTQLG